MKLSILPRLKVLACVAFSVFAGASLSFAGVTAPPVEEVPGPKDLEPTLTFGSGWRTDELQWTIAGDGHGKNPNILSDLDWSDLEIVQASLAAEVRLRDHWRARLEGAHGWIVDGANRDSDYDYNNRKGEFSRSRADTRGGTWDAGLSIGRDLPVAGDTLTLTPWIGVSYHQQRLEDRNGVQDLDTEFHDLGSFPGLDSIYEAEWFGVVFGLDARIRLTVSTRFFLGLRYELVTYEANADWNLRPDLKGFDHSAAGDGWRLNAGFEWDFAPRWTLGIHASWNLFQTRKGVDHSDLSDGTSVETRLNEVKWESAGVVACVTCRF